MVDGAKRSRPLGSLSVCSVYCSDEKGKSPRGRTPPGCPRGEVAPKVCCRQPNDTAGLGQEAVAAASEHRRHAKETSGSRPQLPGTLRCRSEALSGPERSLGKTRQGDAPSLRVFQPGRLAQEAILPHDHSQPVVDWIPS